MAKDSAQDYTAEDSKADSKDDTEDNKPKSKPEKSTLREAAILIVVAVVLYYLMLTFVARPYLIPSESMEPTLHGCTGCIGDRIMVDKVTYDFTNSEARRRHRLQGPADWNIGYKSIRSDNTAGAVGAERAFVRRLRAPRRERSGQAGDRRRRSDGGVPRRPPA